MPSAMSRLKNRRGATAILVALLIAPLLGFAAFVLDVGVWTVGASQLQTAADAAALAGARRLQLAATGSTGVAGATAEAKSTAARNAALGSPLAESDAEVAVGYWDPDEPDPDSRFTTGGPRPNNAVRVVVSRAGGLIFGGAFVSSSPVISRSAVAWIASIQSHGCVLPTAMPYQVLYDKVASAASARSPRPDLPPSDVARIGDISAARRLVTFLAPNYEPNPATGTPATNDGEFIAYNYVSNNAGLPHYQQDIYTCSGVASVDAEDGKKLATNGADLPCRTVRALAGFDDGKCPAGAPGGNGNGNGNGNGKGNGKGNDRGNDKGGGTFDDGWLNEATSTPVCHFRTVTSATTSVDAGCYASAGAATAGVIRPTAWGDDVAGGAKGMDVRFLGDLLLVCAFRDATVTETCNPAPGVTITDKPRGTIVGIIQGASREEIGGRELGNTATAYQRLILVK